MQCNGMSTLFTKSHFSGNLKSVNNISADVHTDHGFSFLGSFTFLPALVITVVRLVILLGVLFLCTGGGGTSGGGLEAGGEDCRSGCCRGAVVELEWLHCGERDLHPLSNVVFAVSAGELFSFQFWKTGSGWRQSCGKGRLPSLHDCCMSFFVSAFELTLSSGKLGVDGDRVVGRVGILASFQAHEELCRGISIV